MGPTPAPDAQSGVDTVPADIQVDDRAVAADGIDRTNRDAFGLRLQQHYHQHAVNETPFLLIAMRSDGAAAPSLDFALFYDCVSQLLSKDDDWLVDFEGHRLIVLMPHSRINTAQRFFSRLKVRLLDAAPQQAQDYLHTMSAIVVPNGESFQNAEDFLAVALEEE